MPLCLFIQSRSYALKLICQRNRRYVIASLAPLRSLESQPWWSYFFLSLNVFVVVATCLYANIIMLLSFVSIIGSLGAFLSATLFLRMDCFVDFFFHHRLRCNWMACCVLIVHSTNCSRKTTSCVRPLNAIKKISSVTTSYYKLIWICDEAIYQPFNYYHSNVYRNDSLFDCLSGRWKWLQILSIRPECFGYYGIKHVWKIGTKPLLTRPVY